MDHPLVMVWLVLLIPSFTTASDEVSPSQVIAPNCTKRCGNMDIIYPFGIEDGCYYKEGGLRTTFEYYKITCNDSFNPLVPFWDTSRLQLLSLTAHPNELRLKYYIAYMCYSAGGIVRWERSWIRAGMFTLSSTKNIFVVTGCDSYAMFTGYRFHPTQGYSPYAMGCITNCTELNDAIDGQCAGVGCCQLPLPEGVFNVSTNVGSLKNHSLVQSFNPCSMGFLVEKDMFRFYKHNLSRRIDRANNNNNYYQFNWVPVVINWSIGKESCSSAKAQGKCLCKNNTICYEPENQGGYLCQCEKGFTGNPYLPQGCTDTDECATNEHECEKPEYCVNGVGDYSCQCPKGYSGEGTKSEKCISNAKKWFLPVIFTAGGGGGIILLIGIAFTIHMKREKRKINKIRESFFRQNGGLLLSQKLGGRDVGMKIFGSKDLVNATNNYSDKNIIGRGAFGIVYRGTLSTNEHVAIKRSLKVDPSQVEQFINEVLVLSQINNKNVVKLLGCCLENEVPLLVYEFITNGTLYDHLDDAIKALVLTWSTRLKIAVEVANVLSYLHNTISTPIIHRDMKSMNILLDENYTAKAADFGASRLVPTDQGQLATMVLGTRGYLDPEYMQTSELTEKSDVYSFGVVLVELLTRKKAISMDRSELERCHAMHFLVNMKEGRLLNILDKSIVSEGTIEQIQLVANLARQCLMLKGEDRPTMKEVGMELEAIRRKGVHPRNEDDGSLHQHNVSFRGGFRGLATGGTSGGIDDSDLYDPRPISTLGGGR